ncbi:uncharacterized protein B0I36DRAFT_357793 [Microdochium trichocladiopsis]|uniref:Uncharacterized protein n=1 Tax=Microdochium trichocladiopsis TaxID=1682393 RepID=A0A9P8YID6_9PEZI|nr:uncharacterized protein B0I36DRAFT_357793 [Microdochium trichocladiopsis]KAH7040503.1 hypothetical protein B0I36DRAFT_357793 [Microdochium trichocladiopsis]
MALDAAFPRASSDSARQPSRFQEGSMNDRVSAKPPPDFLGPDLEAYERQFYVHNLTSPASRDHAGKHHRQERPLSAEAQLGPTTEHLSRPPLTKKSSFFGRLKGALGFGWGSSNGSAQQQQPKDEVKRKHASLQDHCMPPPPQPTTTQQHLSRPPPRTWKSQSQINIPHIPGVLGLERNGSTDRPSREEILESYQQLMASGFFQAHAIQSTRQPGPRGNAPQQATSASILSTSAPVPPPPSRRPPALPSVPSTGARLHVEDDTAASMLAALGAAQSNAAGSRTREDSMDWQTEQDSRYALRGRKRGRTDGDEANGTESSLAQPLRKMAKKLRKIPSSLTSPNAAAAMHVDSEASAPAQRVPSLSMGGLPFPSDRQLRPRGPSPALVVQKDYAPRRSVSASGSIGAVNKLRKRAKSPSPVKARQPPVSRGGLEAASLRSSMESSRREAAEDHYGGGSLKVNRLRERSRPGTPDPLGARPDSFQNVPQVPRIPSIYKQQNVDISSTENTRPRAGRQYA